MRKIFKNAKVDRLYNGFAAEARIWDPVKKETKLITIGEFETESEADAAIKGFLTAMEYNLGKGEIVK